MSNNWLDKKMKDDPEWRGVHIMPPEKITKEKAIIKAFNLFELNKTKSEPLVIFAVDKKSGQEYKSRFQEESPPDVYPTPAREPKVSPPTKKELEGLSSGGPFDFDLLSQLDLPRPGSYDVYVTWAGHKSNQITVNL